MDLGITAARTLFTRASEELAAGIAAFDNGFAEVATHGNGPVTWGQELLTTRAQFAQSASLMRNGATIAGGALDAELAARLTAHADAIEAGLTRMARDEWPDRAIFTTALDDVKKAQELLDNVTSGEAAAKSGVLEWELVDDAAGTPVTVPAVGDDAPGLVKEAGS